MIEAVDRGLARGNGVGLEIAAGVIRGVRLGASTPGGILIATEVGTDADDEHRLLDGFVRAWAELGEPDVPTRLAWFPPGALLRRRDVTGLSGTELTAIRLDLDATRGVGSTVLVDRGPRRWLLELDWDDDAVRRVEGLAERAGFAEVIIEPAPVALARALVVSATAVRRDASHRHSYEYVSDDGVPLAAATVEPLGAQPPDLAVRSTEVPAGWFDRTLEPDAIRGELRRLCADAQPVAYEVTLAGRPLGTAPPGDLRSPIRQCVAVGAATAAAGLAGRVHPVDMVNRWAGTADLASRPWAIERMSDLPDVERATLGGGKRWISRVLPRRQ